MPESWPKTKVHPWRALADGGAPRPTFAAPTSDYAELQVTTNFTFLTGASHPDELVQQAGLLGHRAVAVTDTNTLAGVVRAHVAAKEMGVQLVIGTKLVLHGGTQAGHPWTPSILVYPTDRASYGRLCELLSLGRRRAPKGECHLHLHDLLEREEGLLAAVLPPDDLPTDFVDLMRDLRQVFDDDRLSLVATRRFDQHDEDRLPRLAMLAEHVRVPLLATNDVHYHVPERRPLQDVLTCIQHGCTLDEAGMRLAPNAERHLKSPQEMARLFAEYPEALHRSVQIAERAAGFSLDQVRYEYPDEIVPPGRTPMAYLRELTWEGAKRIYAAPSPGQDEEEGGTSTRELSDKVRRQIEHELTLIEELNYAPYFLTVFDLVQFARSRDILCQGRGAAANSAVCFCLGITSVDPERIDVLFERFVSKERDEPPDIDIDFEHERREEVIQYIYGKYGRHRAALCAEVISYRSRSAVRDVGKALGLSLDVVDRLAKQVDWWAENDGDLEQIRALGLDPNAPAIRRLRLLAFQLQGFPRHLGQHVGGFVIANQPLEQIAVIQNAAMDERTIIEWDKDDVDAMGMIKVDCLGLGMLTCIRKALELVNEAAEPWRSGNGPKLELHNIPAEDPAVYDMICRADTIGVFQIESRAQMSMLPRLKPRCFYDLVIEVAIVRPGPIQGNMVHPFLRRRNGDEPVVYPDERIRSVLGKTLGVPIFQEQAMRVAMVAAGFSPGEADQLRRAINAWKTRGSKIDYFHRRIVEGMVANGYDPEFAEVCFQQIRGFSGYGFPESHSASFALLVYASAWLKCHHPAAFACALMNSQPMGFYAPAQIVRDARDHGVEIRRVDVNFSDWDCTLEPGDGSGTGPALRLGMRQVRGLSEQQANKIAAAVAEHGRFDSIAALWRASGAKVHTMRRLASADAFASMGLDRQRALWAVRKLRDERLPLFEQPSESPPADGTTGVSRLPSVPELRRVIHDYQSTGLSLRKHPVAFIRSWLERRHVTCCGELADEARWPHRRRVAVAGMCLLRQRPGTASGITFMTIEDETGVANIVVHPRIWQRYRRAARDGGTMLIRGRVERQGMVVHVVASQIVAIDEQMQDLTVRSRDFH